MAELNIAQAMRFRVDVKTGLVEQPQRESLMKGDKKANRIIAELMYGSETLDITGVTVKGKFCRPPDLDEIELSGTAEGNLAIVQLTDACYAQSGNYQATVSLVLDDVERTVLFISGTVLRSGSGNAASEDGDSGTGSGTGSGLPSGGTEGQVLVKVSAVAGAAAWKTLTAADVGALPSDGTAANATRLNGKDAIYYMGARNLLDNSDFEIAQAGYGGLHGNDTYLADRWIGMGVLAVNGQVKTYTSTNGYNWMRQVLWRDGRDHGKPYTLVITLPDGSRLACSGISPNTATSEEHVVCEVMAPDGKCCFMVLKMPDDGLCVRVDAPQTGYSVSFLYMDLYEGAFTAENAPPHVPKGYAAELAECRRYYRKRSMDVLMIAYSSLSAGILVPREEMRKQKYTVNFGNAQMLAGYDYNDISYLHLATIIEQPDSLKFLFEDGTTAAFTANQTYLAKIEFEESADL